MTAATYTRYELLRTFRNVRFTLFSLVFPLLLFFLVAGPNRHIELGGLPFPQYYMSGMVAWGTMAAMLGCGARIAAERAVGWNRQLRITPLTTRAYFGNKILSGYVIAGLSMILLYASGLSLGVRMPLADWLGMTGLVLVGLIPFAVLGILVGHLVTPDSVGPALGGGTALLALLGGAFGPIGQTGFLHHIVVWIPSYWLVQAGKVGQGGRAWGAQGWVCVVVWTVVLVRITMRVYARDTGRA